MCNGIGEALLTHDDDFGPKANTCWLTGCVVTHGSPYFSG